ncbi:hypothetical protein AgCh_033627 [Apium graveolens]
MSKDIQTQKLRERAEDKKNEIGSVKKWRKKRQQSGSKRPGVRPGDHSGGKHDNVMVRVNHEDSRSGSPTKFGFRRRSNPFEVQGSKQVEPVVWILDSGSSKTYDRR